MAKDNAGRFKKREDFVPELPMEDYMNVLHVDVLLGAAGAGGVKVIETGLNLESLGDVAPHGVKWVLFGGMYQPSNYSDLAAFNVVGGVDASVQVQRGTRVIGDFAPRSSPDVLMYGQFLSLIGAEGNEVLPYPLDLIHPMPVLSSRLTVMIKNTNHARMNDRQWCVTLFFGFAALSEADDRAMRQQALSQ